MVGKRLTYREFGRVTALIAQGSAAGYAPRRTVDHGKPTNDLVRSAFSDGNDRVFPQILGLYVKPGSIVADVTYGKGVFWRRIPADEYDLRATDLQDGMDCRKLPYGDGEVDCVILDPPYMHSPGGHRARGHTRPLRSITETPAPAIGLPASTTRRFWTCTATRGAKPTASCGTEAC